MCLLRWVGSIAITIITVQLNLFMKIKVIYLNTGNELAVGLTANPVPALYIAIVVSKLQLK